ncbi:RelA/SpoT family protein [Chthonobacter rhizosphaerae]|uniref:RelA/SpoT family protein n=1 Tax=Chthonobacter rhizosphaerae TaxID=2735553 RepID=UPI0015EF9D5D|nr:bifunctional (p)ppGpp synthetase/guanosine-3',5'-bis(diphosphate) 3'-pyrophosphohydrolase [Chthonobacter rhizosphaerae]
MMRQYELVERVQTYNPDCDEGILNRAYVYAMQKHGLQKRASGDPYFSHPLEVAAILTGLHVDEATIVIALLHDTIEDTDATRQEIDTLFGEEIGNLVEGLTKLKKLDLVSKRTEQAENLRKLLLAIAEDVRVLLVKLADRLHNMRTLHYVPEQKRARIAEETMEIYAPLAGRMGMQDMREELEHLAFKTLNPDAYQTISQRLEEIRSKNLSLIGDIERELSDHLAQRGIKAVVKGRQKRPYSIFRKMITKQLGFEQLSDIYGFRVLVDEVDTCYRTLGVVHTIWASVPGRFKDYISTPKQNDYRSLHTTVVGPHRQRVELQIRTHDMNRIAEYGIAAHALYKDGAAHRPVGASLPQLTDESRAYAWLRRTIESLSDGSSPEEFLENTKLELFQDQVFCFTPKGRLINLPRGATPIDFAYAVHTDVGNTCVGCKVNGRIMPLVTQLQNGDEVEIIRSKAQVPPPTWETIAITGKARAAIRRATRDATRKQFASLGRQVLQAAFSRAKRDLSDSLLELALPRLGQPTVADLLAAVGRAEIPSTDVLKAAFPDYKDERAASVAVRGELNRAEEGWFSFAGQTGMKFRHMNSDEVGGRGLPVRSIAADMPVRFAPNGGAVPGDRIVGIITPGEGITIYPIQSPALKAYDEQPDVWLDVRWDIDADDPVRFPAQIAIHSFNEPGSLARIAQTISDNDGNIDNIRMARRTSDFHEVVIDLEVYDLKHLNRIINQLRTVQNVSRVERVNG